MKRLVLSALAFPLALGSTLLTRADDSEAYTFLSGLSQFERLSLSTGTGEGLGFFESHPVEAVVSERSVVFQDGMPLAYRRWQLDPKRAHCELFLADGAPFAAREAIRFSGDLGLADIRSVFRSAPDGVTGFWIETSMRIDKDTTRVWRDEAPARERTANFDRIVCHSPDLLRPATLASITGLSVYARESLWPDRLISHAPASFSGAALRAAHSSAWPSDAKPLRLVGPPASSPDTSR